MVDDVHKKNESADGLVLGRPTLCTPSMVVDVHTSFRRIHTLNNICISVLRLASIAEGPTHLICTLERCIPASLERSAGQTSHYLHDISGASSPRGNRTKAAPRGLGSPPMPVQLVSPPPHWSIPRVIDYITIEAQFCPNRSHYTSHSNRPSLDPQHQHPLLKQSPHHRLTSK